MKADKAAILLLLLVLAFPLSAVGQSGIVVNGADSVWSNPVVYSSELVSTTFPVTPRVTVQYAKSTDQHTLTLIPSELKGLVSVVPARVIIQYSKSADQHVLALIPSQLQYLVSVIPMRVVIQYAKSNRTFGLFYPRELLNDTAVPQISGVTASAARDRVTITWTTDEYATSTVVYGTQRGIYPHTASDTLYAKQHEMVLIGLPSGTVYYFKVRGADRSGNAAESAEYQFKTSYPAYLPTILRRR